MERARYSIVGLLAAALLVACSPMSPYQSTAAELALKEHAAPFVGFTKTWAPLGTDSLASLSRDDQIRGRFWLASCVSELGARFTPAPGGAARAVQIAECMEARGWHLVVRESDEPQ